MTGGNYTALHPARTPVSGKEAGVTEPQAGAAPDADVVAETFLT
jgi:hypothetical protein